METPDAAMAVDLQRLHYHRVIYIHARARDRAGSIIVCWIMFAIDRRSIYHARARDIMCTLEIYYLP